MPNGKPTATTSSPTGVASSAVSPAPGRPGGVRLQHGEVVLRLRADHVGVGFGAVGNTTLDALGAGDDVQVGQDDAAVDDDDAGAGASFGLHFLRIGQGLDVAHALHAHHRLRDGPEACAARDGSGRLSSEWRTAPSMSRCVSSRGTGAIAAWASTSSAVRKAPAASSNGRSWRAQKDVKRDVKRERRAGASFAAGPSTAGDAAAGACAGIRRRPGALYRGDRFI